VRLDFGTFVNWVAMPPDAARQFAKLIEVHANEMDAEFQKSKYATEGGSQ